MLILSRESRTRNGWTALILQITEEVGSLEQNLTPGPLAAVWYKNKKAKPTSVSWENKCI